MGDSQIQKTDEGIYTIDVEDQDGDIYKATFDNDDGITIQTNGVSYICLSQYELERLAQAVENANDMYKSDRRNGVGVFKD